MIVGIIDYGSGNIRSVHKSFEKAASVLSLPIQVRIVNYADQLNNVDKIVFISNWVKKQFFSNLEFDDHNKTEVIYHSIDPIKKISNDHDCTWFLPKISKLDARKKWIIGSVSPKGELMIDDGAKQALKKGKSLLAAGIKKVFGKFNKGDHIKIIDKNSDEYARGLSSFSSSEINKIKGHHSSKIDQLLGYIAKSEVVHKDDMVEI